MYRALGSASRVEQRPRDGDRILLGSGNIKTRIAQVEERWPCPGSAGFGREPRLRVEEALHAFEIAAHDTREEVGGGDVGMPRDQAHRGVQVHAATAGAADVAVGACGFQERGHTRGVGVNPATAAGA